MSAKQRPDSSNILGVSMPAELKARIKKLADADQRTMAQWCAIRLRQIVEISESASDLTTSPAPLVSLKSPTIKRVSSQAK